MYKNIYIYIYIYIYTRILLGHGISVETQMLYSKPDNPVSSKAMAVMGEITLTSSKAQKLLGSDSVEDQKAKSLADEKFEGIDFF